VLVEGSEALSEVAGDEWSISGAAVLLARKDGEEGWPHSPRKHMPSIKSMTRTRSFQSESHAHNTRNDGQGPIPRRAGRITSRRRRVCHGSTALISSLFAEVQNERHCPTKQRIQPDITPCTTNTHHPPATDPLLTMQRTYLYRTLTNAICSSCGRKTRCGSRIKKQMCGIAHFPRKCGSYFPSTF